MVKIFQIIFLLCLAIKEVAIAEVNQNIVDKIFKPHYKLI